MRARLINTRTESPSRILLDALLCSRGIESRQVNGYLTEAGSPAAAAGAVRDGAADACICTAGIAEEAGLQFVPVASEDYELAIRREMTADPRLRSLVALIRSPAYKSLLEKSGGCATDRTGMVRYRSADSVLIGFPDGAEPV